MCMYESKESNGWATLKIHLEDKTPKQIEKIDKAINLLREVGLSFDSGSDYQTQDIELDYSLKGAHLEVRPIRKM